MDEDLLNSIDSVIGNTMAGPDVPQPAPQPHSEVPSPAPEPTPVQTPAPAQNKKKSILPKILIPIITLLVIGGAVVATLFVTGVIGGKDNAPAEEEVDTDITDGDLIAKINKKLEALFGANFNGNELVVNSSNYDDVYLWQNLDLVEEQKINRILSSLDESQAIELTEDQKALAATTWAEKGGALEYFNADTIVAFSGDTVNDIYKDLFSVDADRVPLESQRVQYVPSYDFYFRVPSTDSQTQNQRHYYVNRLVKNGKNAYAYLSGGLYDESTRTAYCDVFTPENAEYNGVCETIPEGASFAINGENSGNYLLRLFTFYLANNGNVYFVGTDSPIKVWDYDPDAEYETNTEE